MTIPLLTDFSQTTEEQRHDLYPVYPNVSSLVDIEISVYPGRECTPSGSLQESDESMGPRKKSKPNPKAEIGSQPTTPNEIPDRGPQQAPEGLIGSAASNAENVDTCASPSEFRTPSAVSGYHSTCRYTMKTDSHSPTRERLGTVEHGRVHPKRPR